MVSHFQSASLAAIATHAAWQVDSPHVVQRNVGEELVRAQQQPFELSLSLSLRDLRHDLSFSSALSFAG
jgi:hypothetical protein